VRDLGPQNGDLQIEVHDPDHRNKLSYLAATKRGRRLYLNRKVVDADQVIVLSRRTYDPLLGYAGFEGAIFPELSDQATRQEFLGRLRKEAPGPEPWPASREATEVAWLLGVPFMVQVIEGAGEEIAHILGGTVETGEAGRKLLDARWRVEVERPADIVVAGISGKPAHHDLGDMARALAAAARVVKPQGRIVLLTDAAPLLGSGMELLRQSESPQQGYSRLEREKMPDTATAFQWVTAVQQAGVFILSRAPGETMEDLFTTPLENTRQVERLLQGNESILFLPDAHKSMAVLQE
jgi:nickel-dependent lactate racemase